MIDYLQILEATPNFTTAKDAKEESELREEVYAEFEYITDSLSLDEKFRLYDLIDQLKMHEDEFRPTIKQEFLELCARGNDLQDYLTWHESRRSVRDIRNRWF